MFKTHPRKLRRRGLSLIETILALTLGLIAVLAVIGFFTSGTASNNRNTAAQQLQHIVAEMQVLYASSATYGDGTENDVTTPVATAGIFPSNMLDDSLTPFNPWGGTVLVDEGPAAESFRVTFTNVPGDSCAKLIAGRSAGFGGNLCGIAVTEDGGATNTVDSAGGFGTTDCQGDRPSITEIDAIGACSSGTDQNDITWFFQ
jgi:type II secretory pathway pseudopilin PulG